MIIGNLNHLSLAGLPAWVRNILLRPSVRYRRYPPERTVAGNLKDVGGSARWELQTRNPPNFAIRSITIYGPIYRW